MSQTTYCKRHPTVESRVSCGRCGDAVCPRCMVHAPVGVRCQDCGSSRPAPTFDVSPTFLIRGVLAGIAAGVAGGILVSLVDFYLPVPYVTAILIAALGFGVGEVVSLSTNRKRGVRLKIIAGLCMFVAFSLITYLTGATTHMPNLLAGGLGFYLAISRF